MNTKGVSGTPFSVSADSYGNSYSVGLFNDTLRIDSTVFTVPVNLNSIDAYFCKLNSKGRLLWCNTIYNNNKYNISLRHVETISDNLIAIYGYFTTPKIKFTKTDSLTNSKGPSEYNGFVACYDSSGKFLSCTKLYSGQYFFGSKTGSNPFNGEFSSDSRGCIYVNFYKSNNAGAIYFKGGGISLTDTISKNIIVKYSPKFDSILWYKEFPNPDHFKINRIRVGEDDNLYLACHSGGLNFNLGKFNFRLRSFSDKGLISIISPKGNFIYSGLVNSDSSQKDNILDIGAIDTNNIYIIGIVSDSILYQNTWYSSLNKHRRKNLSLSFPYVGLVGIHSSKWIRLPISSVGIADFDLLTVGYNAERLSYDKTGHVYGAIPSGDTLLSIGGLSYNVSSNVAFFKLDKMGNALWLRPFTYNLWDLVCSSDSNLIYTGLYYKDIFLDPFKLNTPNVATFYAKTNDYSIIRENVSPGPYCAGDTFVLGYYRYGKYDTSNYFVAEISDKDGNFNGNERELGRIKTTQNGKIKCTIPLFKVVASDAYRIRIRSTNPAVQSFYKRDTLKLLIYSKDKADPGLAESICRGDSIKLNTYGGTKWTWSPNYNIEDQNKRQPLVWPDKDTIYRIIISDSSGCGKTDTAYKRILIRPYLKSILGFSDSLTCGGTLLSIPARFEGGDSNYNWTWSFVSGKSLFPYKTKSAQFNDTLNYMPSDPIEKLAIVLSDGCTAKKDTAFLNIGIKSKVEIVSILNDTLVCRGAKVLRKPQVKGGAGLKYNWMELSTGKIISNLDSLSFSPTQNSKVRLVVENGCNGLGDTTEFNINVKPPLIAYLNTNKGLLNDTILCFGDSLKLFGSGNGGNGLGYKFKWYLDGLLISNADTLLFKTTDYFSNLATSKLLGLVLYDNCTQLEDTVYKRINLMKSPIADFTVGNSCNSKPIAFTFTGTNVGSTSFKWDFAGESTSNIENPSQTITNGFKKINLLVTASNGCKDEITKVINILPQALAEFTVEDVCEDSFALFKNKSTVTGGTLNFKWYFGDGKTSNDQNPQKKYNIGGITKTYNVKLLAISPGCSDSVTKAITINSKPLPGFDYSIIGQTVQFKAKDNQANSFNWTFGDGGMLNTTSNKISYTYSKFPSGKYIACLNTSNLAGCQSDSCIEIFVTGRISRYNDIRFIKVYPNPNNGEFVFEIEHPNTALIEMYNSIGQIVFSIVTNNSINPMNLNLVEGVYSIVIKNGDEFWTQKLIIGNR